MKPRRGKKFVVKELLSLEPGKHYLLKFHPGFVSEKDCHSFVDWCRRNKIDVFCFPTEDIKQLQIQEKLKEEK